MADDFVVAKSELTKSMQLGDEANKRLALKSKDFQKLENANVSSSLFFCFVYCFPLFGVLHLFEKIKITQLIKLKNLLWHISFIHTFYFIQLLYKKINIFVL